MALIVVSVLALGHVPAALAAAAPDSGPSASVAASPRSAPAASASAAPRSAPSASPSAGAWSAADSSASPLAAGDPRYELAGGCYTLRPASAGRPVSKLGGAIA